VQWPILLCGGDRGGSGWASTRGRPRLERHACPSGGRGASDEGTTVLVRMARNVIHMVSANGARGRVIVRWGIGEGCGWSLTCVPTWPWARFSLAS
jgi:hypothetical protein